MSESSGPAPERDSPSEESAAPDARQGAYAFKAGSSLPEDRVETLNETQVVIVRCGEELYSVPLENLSAAFPELAAACASRTGTIDLRDRLDVRQALTRSAVPELITSAGSNNVVRYDGQFYVLPQGLGEVRWGQDDVRAMPGVTVVATAGEALAIARGEIAVGPSQAEAEQAVASAGLRRDSHPVPRLIKTVENYNIVGFEGWYYGLPHSLGPIDLQTVDVIEMPGVIRDVSADVVEKEIQELKFGKS